TGSVLPNGSIVEEVRNGEGATVAGVNFEGGFSPSEKLAFQLGGTAQQTRYLEPQVLFEPEEEGENAIAVEEFVRTPKLYGYFTPLSTVTQDLKLDLTGSYTGAMVVPRVVGEDGALALVDTNPFLDMNLKASYHIDVVEDFHLEISGGVKNIFNSYQQEFDSGPQRDSDFIYGPAAPRSLFLSLKIGNLH
ncbi:MAG: TonB-dependent receptor, partial [Bacteroidota bacterium]